MLVGKKAVQHTFLWFSSISLDSYTDNGLKQATTTVAPTDQYNYSFIIIIIIIIVVIIIIIIYWQRTGIAAGRSGDRIPVGARFSAPTQADPGAHPASYTMGTGSFPGVKRPDRGVDHPPHLVPRLKKQ
jgi:hypothetical protein